MASSDLTPVEEAIDHLVARARPITRSQTVALTNSLDRVLARDYTVPADVPPADNSAVDGYAVRAGDLAGGEPLPVSGRTAAGEERLTLKPGTAVRLFTGSEIPSGADAVIMQERVSVCGDGITVNGPVSEGQNIRRRGQDLAQGELALAAGTRIRPQEMGLLGSIGTADVAVYAKLKVAVLTTGDELVDPGQPLGPGQIYNSNRYTLLGLLAKAGCEVVLCEALKDAREATRKTLERAAVAACQQTWQTNGLRYDWRHAGAGPARQPGGRAGQLYGDGHAVYSRLPEPNGGYWWRRTDPGRIFDGEALNSSTIRPCPQEHWR